MTKKKPASGPEIPPGRACFPHWLASNLTGRKRVDENLAVKLAKMKPKEAQQYLQDLGRREPLHETHAKNLKDGVRWVRVRTMEEMTPAGFKKEHGYKKTLAKIFELVADAEGSVGPLAIKKSCDRVDAAIQAGKNHEFFVAEWPTRKLGKKRPRSR